jgi:uncharacterized damage-inducible protein DinB
MSALNLIRRLHEHRAWVNCNLRAAARDRSEESLRQTFSIGQGSIWKSLVHLYAAEYVWLKSLQGDEQAILPGDLPDKLPGNQLGQRGITTLAQLESKWNELDANWLTYLDKLTESDLDQIVARFGSDGVRRSTRRGDVLLHVCTHAHYTTAQVVNMLRQIGAKKLPDVMLIALARQQMGNP